MYAPSDFLPSPVVIVSSIGVLMCASALATEEACDLCVAC